MGSSNTLVVFRVNECVLLCVGEVVGGGSCGRGAHSRRSHVEDCDGEKTPWPFKVGLIKDYKLK